MRPENTQRQTGIATNCTRDAASHRSMAAQYLLDLACLCSRLTKPQITTSRSDHQLWKLHANLYLQTTESKLPLLEITKFE